MMLSKKGTIESVGLIPAGGRAERISPLPCSKEIFAVGFADILQNGQSRPKVAAHYLLEKMHLAGAKRAYIVLSKGKWDIPAYFGDGALVNMALAYLVTSLPYGVPFTVDSAFPFLSDKRVLFGFPDIILQPDDVYLQLIEKMDNADADLVLGLFPAVRPQNVDMVALNTDGAIVGIDIKPAQTQLKWTWTLAVWNADFTQFLHNVVRRQVKRFSPAANTPCQKGIQELFMGDVVREAIGSELIIDHVLFPHGTYIDIGSPQGMRAAVQPQALDP